MRIDTALLVVGAGPAALVAAKVAGSCGQPCLLVGHQPIVDDDSVALDADAVAVLAEHGLLDVLRPVFDSLDPPTTSPRAFETVLKQHCVADLNVTVYDDVSVEERVNVGRGLRGVLTNGASRWELDADVFIDAATLPTSLSDAITAGAGAAHGAIVALAQGAPDPAVARLTRADRAGDG